MGAFVEISSNFMNVDCSQSSFDTVKNFGAKKVSISIIAPIFESRDVVKFV